MKKNYVNYCKNGKIKMKYFEDGQEKCNHTVKIEIDPIDGRWIGPGEYEYDRLEIIHEYLKDMPWDTYTYKIRRIREVGGGKSHPIDKIEAETELFYSALGTEKFVNEVRNNLIYCDWTIWVDGEKIDEDDFDDYDNFEDYIMREA